MDDHHEKTPSSSALHRKFVLDRDDCVLLVIDIQEKLAAAMPADELRKMLHSTGILIETAKTLGIPILVSAQYPKGLGPTMARIQSALPDTASIYEKSSFSCGSVKEIALKLFQLKRQQIIVCGMEAHVCVFQTARDLCFGNYFPFIPVDAVISRTAANHQIGVALARECGVTITSTEAAVFDLLAIAGTAEFKHLSPLFKSTPV